MPVDPKPIIAIAYDFDGTLTPLPMQEYTIFKDFDIEPHSFWGAVQAESKREGSDPMTDFLRHMIERVEATGQKLTREILTQSADQIVFHRGVDTWFHRINEYVKEKSMGKVEVRHYIISCGNREIIECSNVAHFFHKIYASAYHFGSDGAANFPAVVMTDSAKTQFLFRINKGREELNESVNEHMPLDSRPIPFKQILYIGDGLTDVPCMAVTRQNGGHAIAVYNEKDAHAQTVCRGLWEAGRADFDAAADYTEGSLLDQRIKLILDLKIANIRLAQEHPSRVGVRN